MNEVHVDPKLFGDLPELAPGVIGYSQERDGVVYYPFIYATRPGSGDVGRWLDSLPRDRTIRVPNIINATLQGMLERRGFAPVDEWAAEFEETVEVMERRGV